MHEDRDPARSQGRSAGDRTVSCKGVDRGRRQAGDGAARAQLAARKRELRAAAGGGRPDRGLSGRQLLASPGKRKPRALLRDRALVREGWLSDAKPSNAVQAAGGQGSDVRELHTVASDVQAFHRAWFPKARRREIADASAAQPRPPAAVAEPTADRLRRGAGCARRKRYTDVRRPYEHDVPEDRDRRGQPGLLSGCRSTHAARAAV